MTDTTKLAPATPLVSGRNIGLDICRTIAILLVVLGHMLGHSQPNLTLQSYSSFGIFGVDLFFALSGFLIGRILITESRDWGENHHGGLQQFWYRRWMRTLPLYFFFLPIWMYVQQETSLNDVLPYLVFSQNLAWPMPNFFSLTWSLAVEEWFYFLFPLLLLIFLGLGQSSKASALWAIVLFIVLPFLARLQVPETISGAYSFDEGLRHVVVYRLDAIGCGVGIAYIFCHHRALFDKIGRLGPLLLVLAIPVMMMPKWGYPGMLGNDLGLSVYLLVSALVFAGLIPFFNAIRITKLNVGARFVLLTSRLSYSMYLGHIIVFIVVMQVLKRTDLYDVIYPNPWLLYPLFIIGTYVLAWFTQMWVERPFLWLRDRSASHHR